MMSLTSRTLSATAVLGGVYLCPSVSTAAELDQMFDTLEPAYTTIAGAEACNLRPIIGAPLWRYAHARVRDLEAKSRLSETELQAKRSQMEAEAQQIVAIGACGSVLVAFQVMDKIREASGIPYPADDGLTPTAPNLSSPPMTRSPSAVVQPRDLINRWMKAYVNCRGGIAEAADTMNACDDREDLAEKLAKAKYCETEDTTGAPTWTPCALLNQQ